jgi:DNA-binding CsgD family transcriptional regulator
MENIKNELVQLNRTFFWQSEKIIKSDKWEDLDELFYQLPSDTMHTHHPSTMAIQYFDPEMRMKFGFTKDNIQEIYNEEVPKRIEPSNYRKNFQYAVDFVKRDNKHEIGVMFQHMNLEKDPNAAMEWYVSFIKYSKKARGLFTLDFKIRFLEQYQNKFMKLIALDKFVHKNMDRFQALTPREIEIITKLAQGHSNQEIGEEFHIAKYTVDTHRKNIMNKLEMKRFVDLIRFAEAFDLV